MVSVGFGVPAVSFLAPVILVGVPGGTLLVGALSPLSFGDERSVAIRTPPGSRDLIPQVHRLSEGVADANRSWRAIERSVHFRLGE